MSYVLRADTVRLGEELPCHPNHIVRVDVDAEIPGKLGLIYWEYEGMDD